MEFRSILSLIKTSILVLVFQDLSWNWTEALPAVALEPDYDVSLHDGYDRTDQPPSEIAYTFKPNVQQSTPRNIDYSEATAGSMSTWDGNRDNISPRVDGNDDDSELAITDTSELMASTMISEPDVLPKTTLDPSLIQSDATVMTPTDAPSNENNEQTSGVVFRLYTRAHPLKEKILQDDTLEGTAFDVGRSTVFIIHGFTGDANSDSVTLIRDAMLWAEDINVVVVDWAPLAAGPHYEQAVNNTRVVAAALATRVAALVASGLPLALVHLVGFSLGAQVAGQTGSALADTVGRVSRITAMDPARPGFFDAKAAHCLDSSDAEFVLVLHTASGIVSFEEPLGHADFYANRGRSPQPACTGKSVHVVCSHLIAPRYFAESIYKPQAFRATLCRTWQDYEAGLCAGGEDSFLGPATPSSTRGTYFFRTNAEEPYGRGADIDDSLGARATDEEEDNRLDGRTGRKHDVGAAAASNTLEGASGAAAAVSTAASALLFGVTLLLGATVAAT